MLKLSLNGRTVYRVTITRRVGIRRTGYRWRAYFDKGRKSWTEPCDLFSTRQAAYADFVDDCLGRGQYGPNPRPEIPWTGGKQLGLGI